MCFRQQKKSEPFIDEMERKPAEIDLKLAEQTEEQYDELLYLLNIANNTEKEEEIKHEIKGKVKGDPIIEVIYKLLIVLLR